MNSYITLYSDGAWSVNLTVSHLRVFFFKLRLFDKKISNVHVCIHFPFPNGIHVEMNRLMLPLILIFWSRIRDIFTYVNQTVLIFNLNFRSNEKYFQEETFFPNVKKTVLKVRLNTSIWITFLEACLSSAICFTIDATTAPSSLNDREIQTIWRANTFFVV